MSSKAPDVGAYYPTESNPLLEKLSRGLAAARGYGDKVPLPDWLGGGVGNLFVGTSPEEIHAWAQGDSPFMQNNYSDNLTNYGRLKPERVDSAMSTAFLPVADAYGVSKGLASLGARSAANLIKSTTVPVAEQVARRSFIKGAGAIAAGLTALRFVPKETEKIASKVAPVKDFMDHYHAASVADNDEHMRLEFHGLGNPEEDGVAVDMGRLDRVLQNPKYAPYAKAQQELNDLSGNAMEQYYMGSKEVSKDFVTKYKETAAKYDKQFGKGFSEHVVEGYKDISHQDNIDLLDRFYGPEEIGNYLHMNGLKPKFVSGSK